MSEKRSTPPTTPILEHTSSSKLTKFDEELIFDIQSQRKLREKEREQRFSALRIPLDLPTQEEMQEITQDIRSVIVLNPHAQFSFIIRDATYGLIVDGNDGDNDGLLMSKWIQRVDKWLFDYKKCILYGDEEACQFALKYMEEQLHAYFQYIADTWNAKFTVVQLVPKLGSSYCGFETKVE